MVFSRRPHIDVDISRWTAINIFHQFQFLLHRRREPRASLSLYLMVNDTKGSKPRTGFFQVTTDFGFYEIANIPQDCKHSTNDSTESPESTVQTFGGWRPRPLYSMPALLQCTVCLFCFDGAWCATPSFFSGQLCSRRRRFCRWIRHRQWECHTARLPFKECAFDIR